MAPEIEFATIPEIVVNVLTSLVIDAIFLFISTSAFEISLIEAAVVVVAFVSSVNTAT